MWVTSMRTEPEVAEYFEAARGWDLNRAQAAERSAKRAWFIAAVATLLTVLALVAVAGLTPMKTVEPFVIRVDNSTGIVDVVPVLTGKADVPEAVTRYFVTQYVPGAGAVRGRAGRERLRAGGCIPLTADEPGVGRGLESEQPGVAAQPVRGRYDRAGAGERGVVSLARERSRDLVQVRFLTARQQGGQGTRSR